jgi:cobalt/nickel transport system permease protein
MPDYTPTFIKSPQLGYILSAVFGTGLIILIILFIGWVAGLVSRLRPKSNA